MYTKQTKHQTNTSSSSALFRDRITTIATAVADDGTTWNLCAQFEKYERSISLGLRFDYRQFKYSFFITCYEKDTNIEILQPYLDSYLRALIESESVKRPPIYQLRPIPGTSPTQAAALQQASSDAFLRTLSKSANRSLDYLTTRQARRILVTGTSHVSRYIKQDYPAFHAGTPAEQLHKLQVLATLNKRLQLLTHPNRKISELALYLLDSQTINSEAPLSADDLLNAAALALS